MTGDRAALKEGRYCLREIIPVPRQAKIGEFPKVLDRTSVSSRSFLSDCRI
jgi:hypothetical protein